MGGSVSRITIRRNIFFSGASSSPSGKGAEDMCCVDGLLGAVVSLLTKSTTMNLRAPKKQREERCFSDPFHCPVARNRALAASAHSSAVETPTVAVLTVSLTGGTTDKTGDISSRLPDPTSSSPPFPFPRSSQARALRPDFLSSPPPPSREQRAILPTPSATTVHQTGSFFSSTDLLSGPTTAG